MIGCHSLESRYDPFLNRYVQDYDVKARKYLDQVVLDEVDINHQYKRKYWDLYETGEGIGLSLTYHNQSKLSSIMCFAWCNPDMLDSAPTREFDDAMLEITSTAKILQNLVMLLNNVQ